MPKYTDEEIKQIVAEALNTYCFQNIWQEVPSEFRVNIIPHPISDGSGSGNVQYRNTFIPLPDPKELYYVYELSAETTYGINNKLLENEWIDTAELCNKHDILIHTYHLSGLMFTKSLCYIYPLENKSGYLLAINKKMATVIINQIPPTSIKPVYNKNNLYKEMLNNIRVTIYYDSDITNKITIKSSRVGKSNNNNLGYTERQELLEYISLLGNDRNKLTIFVDGYERYLKGQDSIPDNSYVDIIFDENVIFGFDVDLTDSKNNIGFLSEIDTVDNKPAYKQLIHIPKELNPENKVLTHNTMTIYVRRKESDGTVGDGVYLHRCAKRGVTQVTHNDIGIAMFVLDAFKDYLAKDGESSHQNIVLHIQVRQHNKDNILIRDKNYIDLLYTLDDETIVDHLVGKIEPEKLDFWKASHLEKSKYIEMMFDVPNVITPANMYDYVEGLGYYQTISLICKRIYYSILTEWFGGSLLFSKPYIYQNNPIYPLVYLNGKKINNTKILVDNNYDRSVAVGLDSSVNWNVGDLLTVEMFLDGNKTIYSITPKEGNNTITIPYSSFDIIEEIDSNASIKGLLETYTKEYKEFTEYTGNLVITTDKNNGTTILFGPSVYNRTFIIQNKTRVYRHELNIDNLMQNGDPIIVELKENVTGTTKEVPLWYTPRIIVFLNGRYLIEGLDYTIYEDYGGTTNTLYGKQIVIQNFEYMKTSGNTIEYFITSAEIENNLYSFAVYDKDKTEFMGFHENQLELLFETLTTVHVDGYIESETTYKGNYVSLPTNKYRNGAPFELLTSIPEIVKSFIEEWHENDDLERIEILTEYFYGKGPELPDVIVMPQSHRCYSVYTAPIIRDLVYKTNTSITLDPDIERFKQQLSPEYDKFLDADLVMNEEYDLRFVDVYPHYRNFKVDDYDTYKVIIDMVVNKLLPKDYDTNYEIINDPKKQ